MIFDPAGSTRRSETRSSFSRTATSSTSSTSSSASRTRKDVRGFNVAFIRSSDQGENWSGAQIVDKLIPGHRPRPGHRRGAPHRRLPPRCRRRSGERQPLCRLAGRPLQRRNAQRRRLHDVERRRGHVDADRQAQPELRRNIRLPPLRARRRRRHGRRLVLRLPKQHAGPGHAPHRQLADPLPQRVHRTRPTGQRTHVDGPFDSQNFPPGGRFFPGDYLGLDNVEESTSPRSTSSRARRPTRRTRSTRASDRSPTAGTAAPAASGRGCLSATMATRRQGIQIATTGLDFTFTL